MTPDEKALYKRFQRSISVRLANGEPASDIFAQPEVPECESCGIYLYDDGPRPSKDYEQRAAGTGLCMTCASHQYGEEYDGDEPGDLWQGVDMTYSAGND